MLFLTINECKNFISFFFSQIEIKGILQILENYNEIDNINIAINSLYNNLLSDLSFQDSLKYMKIRFPILIESILINSFENSILDYALHDLNEIYQNYTLEEDLFNNLSKLVDKYNNSLSKNNIICEDCFLTELEKILKRAEIEKAYEIIFEQDGESFFIQKFLGIKVVKYIEPSHSKIYNTIITRLENLYKTRKYLNLLDQNIFVEKIEENKYRLIFEDITISFTFR